MDDSDSEEPGCDSVIAGQQASESIEVDAVVVEMRKWKDIQKETVDKFKDEQGIVNEFRMQWELRQSFPLHFIVFKQCASHLSHEANVEQIFSLAGRLADPNMLPENLTRFTRVHFNGKAYKPPCDAILVRYMKLFTKAGQHAEDLNADGEEEEETDNVQ
mmetsp:Transcript_22988/g.62962  ORF Transcript_22988/g.62962 Transcript_22988/m.62962 type:complete len:160 (-) Transcript_22988:64-543(-)